MMTSLQRYLVVMVAVFSGVLALTWIYTASARVYFLDTGYGEWAAKLSMIRDCNVGDTVILGDSRAGAAFIPKLMPGNVRNLALSGSTAIEAYFEARAIYRCPRPPSTVYLSFAPTQYEEILWLWSHSVSYGQLSYADLEEIATSAARVGNKTLFRPAFGADPPPAVKNWLTAHYFPSYDFAALIASHGFGRRQDNERFRAETLAGLGQHVVGTPLACAEEPGREAGRQIFKPNTLVDDYLGRLIDLLHDLGASITILPTPVSNLTQAGVSPGYVNAYRAYLQSVANQHPWLQLPKELFPVLDRCSFGDPFHLNQNGAELYTKTVSATLLH